MQVRNLALTAPLLGVSSLLSGFLTISYVIAFTAMVYSGPFAPHLAQGIAHALLGCMVTTLLGSLLMSYRGAILHTQDITAIILAGSLTGAVVGGTLAPDAMAASMGLLVVLASAAAGLGALLFGLFRLGALARFIPHPVIGGFLAATGYLLVMAAIGMCLKDTVSLLDPGAALQAGAPQVWLPWILAGLGLALIGRRFRSDLLLPCGILVLVAGFFIALALAGMTRSDAAQAGLLLGPFGSSSFFMELNPRLPVEADWGAVLGQLVLLPAIMALTIIGTTLNGSAMETVLRRDFDMERDLRGTGIANIGAALVGGLPAFHSLSGTILADRLGLRGRTAPIVAAICCAGVLLFGAGVLEGLPVGVFAAIVAFLGFDLLMSWLWDTRETLRRSDYLLILAILAVAIVYGFLVALVMGFLAAMVLFLITYARIDVVRLRSSAGEYRSRVERSVENQAHLAEAARDVRILGLDGYLFFGTANALRSEVTTLLRGGDPPRGLILDFARVTGIDASAMQSLAKITADCAVQGVTLRFTALADADAAQLARVCPPDMLPLRAPSLDAALEQIESDLLTSRPEPMETPELRAIVARLEELATQGTPSVRWLECPPETRVIAGGGTDRDLFLLREGQLRAQVTDSTGTPLRVAGFLPGAIIGELAHYADVPRTADILTDTHARLLGVDLDALTAMDPALAGQVHDHVARVLARRVVAMTGLLRRARI